ncbi:hypothetical protein C8R43DRAFT_1141254 [Mycena crocata]|nr:hypothetical protein C8R43DRAFT_1141254 [Mycena crocata]
MSSRVTDDILGDSNPDNPSPDTRPGSSIQHPMFVNSSPETSPAKDPSSLTRDHRPLILTTRQHRRSSVIRTTTSISNGRHNLTTEQATSSVYNRNIFRGPPSVISRGLNRAPAHRSASGSGSNNAQPYPPGRLGDRFQVSTRQEEERAQEQARRARREARDDAERAAELAMNPPRPRPTLHSIKPRIDDGAWRETRSEPLTAADLFQTDVRSPLGTTDRVHQRCSICLQIKSHPVFYVCGHGHCYVCARLWLEERWNCPECRAIMHTEPIRIIDYEKGMECDFPGRRDESVVDYSWERLRFPRRLRILELGDQWEPAQIRYV